MKPSNEHLMSLVTAWNKETEAFYGRPEEKHCQDMKIQFLAIFQMLIEYIDG